STRGNISQQEKAFVIDEVTLPVPNPWKRNVRLSGLDFFKDGRAAVCTYDGDVWIVDGIDAGLEKVTWRRYATGLHEPMGLVVVEGEVYVADRNGIVRLHDENGDGEAEYYENFSNVVPQTAETREFAMGIVEKPGGGFYLPKGGQLGGTTGIANGTVVEVSADGRRYEIIAHGLRQPFIGIDPESGRVTSSDQQGNWVPATPIHVIEAGKHYGFIPTNVEDPVQTEAIAEPPVWIPHIVNQSGAGQVVTRNAKLGPLGDSLLHIGYNRPELFKIYFDEGGEGAMRQGAVASAVTGFPCALLGGAMNPTDGLVYLEGFRIWGTALDQISGLFRVRYTGATSRVPEEIRSSEEGIYLRFGFEVDEAIATSFSSYTVERWNYKRTKAYGSGHYRPDGEPGQEKLAVSSIYLSQDGHGIFLGIPGMAPVQSMRVTYRVPLALEVPEIASAYLTIHQLRDLDLASVGFGEIEVDLSEREVAAAGPALQPSVAEGEKTAQLIGCVGCHSVDGSKIAAAPGLVTGPSWKGLWGTKREFADGRI
ncbi:MAG: hypothetical protein ACC661_12380, partial [Verrucomicrobiales bacterium]